MSEAAAVQVVRELRELREAIREAIGLGIDGEAIAGIDLLIERFPDLTPDPPGAFDGPPADHPRAVSVEMVPGTGADPLYRQVFSDGSSRLIDGMGGITLAPDSEGGGDQ